MLDFAKNSNNNLGILGLGFKFTIMIINDCRNILPQRSLYAQLENWASAETRWL